MSIATIQKLIQSKGKSGDGLVLRRMWNKILSEGEVEYKGAVLLAHSYRKPNGTMTIAGMDTDEGLRGWFVSEKYDGYRAVWTGTKFVSRNGKEYFAPEWFKAIMPKHLPLDGELYFGRGQFERCGVFRRKTPHDEDWVDATYEVFDMPAVKGSPFQDRVKLMDIVCRAVVKDAHPHTRKTYPKVAAMLPKNWSPVRLVHQTRATTVKRLMKQLDAMVAAGGEGLMLRDPESLYPSTKAAKFEGKRCRSLLKLKKSFDTECKIIGYKPGAGKYKGKLGAFHCQLVSNPKVKFHLSGVTDKIRDTYKTTHPVGTVVTFTYNEVGKTGVPRFPRYLRIRKPA